MCLAMSAMTPARALRGAAGAQLPALPAALHNFCESRR